MRYDFFVIGYHQSVIIIIIKKYSYGKFRDTGVFI